MHLTDEQRQIGKANFHRVLGTTRRDFLLSLGGGAAATAGLGYKYFEYDKSLEGERLKVGIIGTGDEGNVLIGALNPDFIEVRAIADIRPYSVHRAFYGDHYSPSAAKARPGLNKVYGYADREAAEKEIEVFTEYEKLLERDDIEAVIIALPLFLHDVAAIKAMKAGKHVLTEKLMAHSVRQCKEMARVAEETGLLLATGHQRHYSVLYENAVDTIRRGVIGDIHHIRAQWHRNNMPGSDSWTPPLPHDLDLEEVKDQIRAARNANDPAEERAVKEQYKIQLELESWESVLDGSHPKVKLTTASEKEAWAQKVAQKRAQLEDIRLKGKLEQYGYQGGEKPNGEELTPLEELIRWRLWNRTGGGLMAELGSHQLDAAGIFISAQLAKGVKAKPLSVTGVGGRHLFPADRDVDDHVYCMYEYPGRGYYVDDDPEKGIADESKKVVVTYSSINGNGYGGYGEVVLGTEGTLILEREKETYLFSKKGASTKVSVSAAAALTDSYETGGAAVAEAVGELATADVSRGYTEEIEHWAWCIRNGEPAKTLHCPPRVALADAVIALASNIAIENKERIEFKDEWFDPTSDAVLPGESMPAKAGELLA